MLNSFKNRFTNWPRTTPEVVRKFFPETDETIPGTPVNQETQIIYCKGNYVNNQRA